MWTALDNIDRIEGVRSQYIRLIDSIVRLTNLRVSSHKIIYSPLNKSLCNMLRFLPFRLPYISTYKFQTFSLPILNPSKEYPVWKIARNCQSNLKSLSLVPYLTKKKTRLLNPTRKKTRSLNPPEKITLRVTNRRSNVGFAYISFYNNIKWFNKRYSTIITNLYLK